MRAVLSRAWHSPTLMTWGSLLVRLAGVVVILPIVLRRFSPPEVAVWQLFASLMTLVLLMDLGLSPTFSRLLAYARGVASLDDMRDMRQLKDRPPAPAGAGAGSIDRKSTRLNSSHSQQSRMPSSA